MYPTVFFSTIEARIVPMLSSTVGGVLIYMPRNRDHCGEAGPDADADVIAVEQGVAELVSWAAVRLISMPSISPSSARSRAGPRHSCRSVTICSNQLR